MLTVDTPVAGARLRDVRNGMTVPPQLTLRTFVDGATHPRWWFDLLTTEPLSFASLTSSEGTVGELIDRVFDPAITMADLEWARGQWPGKLVAKGVQSVADAQRVVAAGADGVLLSSHGGRQLDRAPVPLELVPSVREAVDGRARGARRHRLHHRRRRRGGDRDGRARPPSFGRAYLYGLMAGGQRGVARAVQILSDEVAPHPGPARREHRRRAAPGARHVPPPRRVSPNGGGGRKRGRRVCFSRQLVLAHVAWFSRILCVVVAHVVGFSRHGAGCAGTPGRCAVSDPFMRPVGQPTDIAAGQAVLSTPSY